MEIGSLTDWLSVGANIVMAVTAVVSATLWFTQKAKLNTLDISHKLAFDFENNLWKINERMYSNVLLRNEIHHDIVRKVSPKKEIEKLVLAELDKKTTTDLSEIAYLYSNITKLERHNVKIKASLYGIFEEVIKARNDYLNSHYTYLGELALSQDDLNSEKLSKAKNLLERKKRILSNIFENKLAKLDINNDYEFKPSK
ncbi:hypothetical protein [Serratia sp. OS31]|uniref:hypothetical protein n=1 Tax=Serratia sp. OS31 TaxID=2760844 RepID=UPI001600E2D0|nr:hypothetical protein [Serratia sp. OS31]MBB1583220.1 hypothetical protein [Serratia sp. OS31]